MGKPPPLDVRPEFRGLRTWTAILDPSVDVIVTTDPGAPVLDTFYTAYDQSFVLPSEKEELAGFRACLQLNDGPQYERLSAEFGPFREIIATLSPKGSNDLIGAVSLVALAGADTAGPCVTANLSYVFIAHPFRGRGWLRRLLAIVERLVSGLFDFEPTGASPRTLIFLEQNDPLELSPEDYALDSTHAGIDQFDRLRIWQKMGVRLLRLPYAQPALAPGQLPTTGLLYGVLHPQGPTLESCLLKSHLKGFFGVSVLKGRALETDPVAGPQIAWLERLCTQREDIDLLDPGPVLEALAAGADMPISHSFLDLLPRHAIKPDLQP
jgi:hypothetical protein